MRLRVDEMSVELAAGDSAYFAADVPHGYANAGRTACAYHVAALIMRPRRASTSIGVRKG